MSGFFALAIETSNPSAVEAAEGGDGARGAGGGMGIAIERCDEMGKGVDEPVVAFFEPHQLALDPLMPTVEALTRRMGLRPMGLRRIGVSAGPGGFTALRVAITVTKMLAHATGARCIGVPTAECVARRSGVGVRCAVLLASKGETAFATCFDEMGRVLEEGSLVDAAGMAMMRERFGLTRVIADRFVPTAMAAWAGGSGVELVRPVFDPLACLELSRGREGVSPEALAPIYPREPEAVTKWKALRAARGGT